MGYIGSFRLVWATQQGLISKKKKKRTEKKYHLEKGKNGFPGRTSVRKKIAEVRK